MSKLADWLFTFGLILPALYVSFQPGFYFTLWYRVITSIPQGGVTLSIFFAGATKALLYFSTLISKRVRNARAFISVSDLILIIHLGVGLMIVSLILSAAIIRLPRLESLGMRASFVFLLTEFMLFPILGILYLQDIIRYRKAELTIVLLLSVSMYLCLVFLTTSSVIEANPAIADAQNLSVLEAAGSKLQFLILLVAASTATGFFWQSTGLYSVDIAPPPTLVSGLYVLTLALFFYYHNIQRSQLTSKFPVNRNRLAALPLDAVRMALTILAATVLAFSIAAGADLTIPPNVAGRALQLLILLIPLLAAYLLLTEQGVNDR